MVRGKCKTVTIVTVFYVFTLSLWGRAGVRASGCLFHHSHNFDGVTTAGNGTSHFSTGNASTP
ncbi:hypothetical protein SAMN03159336_2360 [Enterobacter sp. NFIX59]|nr:hypothetical protein SAMN03159336_2360 [Enterobacter sp. NFIX59]